MQQRQRTWIIISAVLLFAALIALFAASSPAPASPQASSIESKDVFEAPRQNVWADLTETEADAVYGLLREHFEHLNLTKHPKTAWDNSVSFIEVLRPNKTDALPYIELDAATPARWARVALSQSIDEEAFLVYYMVGPLPITPTSDVLPLTYCYNSGRNYVRNPIGHFTGMMDYALALAENISDVTEQLLGASANRANPADPEGLLAIPRPVRIEDGGMVQWMQLYRPGMQSNARSILPQGIYAKLNTTSRNIDQWSAGEWYYNGVIYPDIKHFRAAVSSPGFEKLPRNLDGPWTATEDFDSSPPGRELPPPVSIQPNGPRYDLDKKQNFISWMGFEFYLSTAQSTGVSLFDIRFKGSRVMYELGLQEAMAHYAGDDPQQGGLEFLDTFFGMGKNAFELVPGYDCPAYADYLSTTYHFAEEAHQVPNSVCVFEFTADYLLSRHTSQFAVTASRNTYLTVRSVSTVGNYDYTIDYQFFLDGAIEVKVRASGFIFAAFYAANVTSTKDEYGYHIHDSIASSMHDHVINFKADLDVAGTKNNMVRVAVEPLTRGYEWDKPDVPVRNTMHLVEKSVTKETGLDWPKNSGEMYVVYSADAKNAWGERRGYRITSGTGMGTTPHLTILNSTPLGDSARWAEKDVWVVQQSDLEPKSADPLNFLDPLDPIVNFGTMVSGESVEDEDLVVFFNLGAHHVPTSGDLPNTLMHTSATSVMFLPHNFNDRDPSRETVQGVRLTLGGRKGSGGYAGEEPGPAQNTDLRSGGAGKKVKPKARYFGGTYEEGVQVPLGILEPDLESYRSAEHGVTDLSFNGSAAGVFLRGDE